MKSNVILKVRNASKVATISNLFSDSTLEELLNEICRIIDINEEEIEILNGFPPKVVNIDHRTTTLSEANILSGDSLIVKANPESNLKKPKLDNTNSVIKPTLISDASDCRIRNGDPTQTQVKSAAQSEVSSLTKESQIIKGQNSQSILITKKIPSDNSCLFASIFFCLNNGDLSRFDSDSDRQMIAAVLLSDPEKFNSAYLDNKTPTEYSNWIMNKDNWGGGIELSLMSQLYEIEIDVVNTQYNRVDKFGENEFYTHRILILYDGIHYDALVREYLSNGQTLTKFPISDEEVLVQAEQLAAEARASKQYTDLHGFSVKCRDCDQVLVGQRAVAAHAMETGHSNFGEVSTG